MLKHYLRISFRLTVATMIGHRQGSPFALARPAEAVLLDGRLPHQQQMPVGA